MAPKTLQKIQKHKIKDKQMDKWTERHKVKKKKKGTLGNSVSTGRLVPVKSLATDILDKLQTLRREEIKAWLIS